jgi:hypothetical protein
MGSHFSGYVKRFGLLQGASLYARTKFTKGAIEVNRFPRKEFHRSAPLPEA